MSDFVWVSHAPSDPTLLDRPLKTDRNVDSDDAVIEISKVARQGGAIAASQFPTEAWGEVGEYREHHFPGHWPELSYFSGLWLISGKVAEILGGFDLGEGAIAPVRLSRRDRVTPVPGDWFFWNVGNVKETFLPDRSERVRPAPGRAWRTLDARDHDLKCSSAALGGPDIWFEPKLRGVLLFSDPLGRALVDADLATDKAGFGQLIKCDVIQA